MKVGFQLIFRKERSMKTGRDLILEYCKRVVGQYNSGYVLTCEEIIEDLERNKFVNIYDHCPSAYGFDDFVGDCEL